MPKLKKRGRSFSAENQPLGKPWDACEIAKLGTARDSAIASQLGRSRQSVIHKRRALGIPAFFRPGRPPLSENATALQLGGNCKCNSSASTGL